MNLNRKYYYLSIFLLYSCSFFGQNISIFQQFNGKYDFVFIGNTLNTIENNGVPAPPCTILTSAAATLNLNPTDIIQKAYLYWAGSGTGDFNVNLNGQNIIAQRNFPITNSAGLPCFSAFADVTTLVQTTGNGLYTLSDLDLTAVIDDYCPRGGNFGGWAIVVVYKNPSLSINQLNIYDGLEAVPSAIDITLNSLNVIDNIGAKIGFIAWEGDKNIANNESLRINGNLISNPPLNPADNAFNGTNSFTGANDLYNMDLDVYNIQNNISIGDTTAQIQLTSDQDFVMINVVVTNLNSQLPDATIRIDNTNTTCDSRQVLVDYTVLNINGTLPIPVATPIAIYANGILIANTLTNTIVPIGGSISRQISLQIPTSISNNFILKFSVDDNGIGQGILIEIDENNNSFSTNILLDEKPKFNFLPPLYSCNKGLGTAYFDFSNYENLVKINFSDLVSFFENSADANNNLNPISNINNYNATNTPKQIFVRLSNANCISFTSFMLHTKNCEPVVYNVLTPNNDGDNDSFFIDGLRNIFINFELSIYNRWGTLVWTGNNNSSDWNGTSNQKNLLNQNEMPTGTYFYVLELHDNDFPNPINGYLYLTR